VLNPLDTRQEIGHIDFILKEGSSIDRQPCPYQETEQLAAVVDRLVKETITGC
jgi:hypothetical protein